MEKIDFKNLKKVSFMCYGSDSYIYSCECNGKKYALKLFESPEDIFVDGFEEKLDLIKGMNLKRSVLPSYVVMDGGKSGLLTPLLKDGSISQEDDAVSVYYALKNAKKSIVELHEHDVVHGDIHNGNFLMKNGIRYLHDFDNSEVESFDKIKFNRSCCSFPAYQFVSCNGVVKNLDIFLFNFITYSELNGWFRNMSIKSAFQTAVSFISENAYGMFKSKDSRAICDSIAAVISNDQYLIDTVSLSDVKKYSPRVWKNR